MAEAARRALAERPATGFESRTGKGVVGWVDGRRVAVGNLALLRDLGVDPGPLAPRADAVAAAGQSPMYVAVDDAPAGLIAVADPIKPTSREAVAGSRRLGLETVMLTGDNPRTAASVARRSGSRASWPRCHRTGSWTRSAGCRRRAGSWPWWGTD